MRKERIIYTPEKKRVTDQSRPFELLIDDRSCTLDPKRRSCRPGELTELRLCRTRHTLRSTRWVRRTHVTLVASQYVPLCCAQSVSVLESVHGHNQIIEP